MIQHLKIYLTKASHRSGWFIMLLLLSVSGLLLPSPAIAAKSVRIGVLMANQTRQDTVDGFKSGMAEHAAKTGAIHQYNLLNAEGDRSRLAGLAKELIGQKPDIAIAAGGIEADALRIASEGTGIPVIFLAVSSAVKRGLVASMVKPGSNLTGIDTNDTPLVEKRLWYISKLLPKASRVLCFHIPSIAPSVASIELARKAAPRLGLELQVIEVASKDEIAGAAAKIHRDSTDVILLLPVAPVDAVVNKVLLPLSLREKIPIMGYNEQSLERGAFAAYGSSRYDCGAQAARLAIKVLHGADPATLPSETPDDLNLTINRYLVSQLGLKLSSRSWSLADKVVETKP